MTGDRGNSWELPFGLAALHDITAHGQRRGHPLARPEASSFVALYPIAQSGTNPLPFADTIPG